MTYVKFTSHRARKYGLPVLSNQQGFWSFSRETGKGVYQATPAELATLRSQKRIKFTVLRAPYDDLRLCW